MRLYNGVFISPILNDAFFYAKLQFSYFFLSSPFLRLRSTFFFPLSQLRKLKIARRRARLTFHFSRDSSSIYFLSKLLEDGPGHGEKGWPGGVNCRRGCAGFGHERESESERRGEGKRDGQSLKTSTPTCWDALIINSISYRHALTFFGLRW